MTRFVTYAALGAALVYCAVPGAAQMRDNQDKTLTCKDSDDRRSHLCDLREQSAPVTSKLEVDASPNGGVSVKGWLKSQVLVRSKVTVTGDSEAESKDILSQVQVQTSGGRIHATGPKSGLMGKQKWSVSFEVFVPQHTDLQVSTTNGGVQLSDVKGNIEFASTNGGIQLARLAGSVKGSTTNGGVHIELEGTRWDGDKLDVHTTNGGVTIKLGDNYSARFAASTTNGGIHSDFPGLSVNKGWMSRSLEGTLGSGGGSITVATTNGGVHIGRRS